MSLKKYPSYEEAAKDYLENFRALRDTPATRTKAVTRGGAEIPEEFLIDHAEVIADISSNMIPLAKECLEAQDPLLREGISGHLLAQAAAELQVAADLLQIATEEKFDYQARVPRSVRVTNLQNTLSDMEMVMSIPVSKGLIVPDLVRRSAISANTTEEAKKLLQQTATVAASAISQRVIEFGGDVALNLICKTEWASVIEGAGLLKKEIGEKLIKIKEGLSEIIKKAVSVAVKTLLNVYDKIMALLEKDIEDKIRKQIKEWLEKIRTGDLKPDLFESLVNKMYRLDSFKNDLKEWIQNTGSGKEVISRTANEVSSVADRFTLLIKRMNLVEDVIGMARLIKVPQLITILAGIQIGLLGIIVYSGYDYIGYKQVSFMSITKGIGEIIQENLNMNS